jgi:hypothetical protein
VSSYQLITKAGFRRLSETEGTVRSSIRKIGFVRHTSPHFCRKKLLAERSYLPKEVTCRKKLLAERSYLPKEVTCRKKLPASTIPF